MQEQIEDMEMQIGKIETWLARLGRRVRALEEKDG